MLITRPNHDITTDYLFFWSEDLIKQAQKSGIRVVDLSKRRANRKEFISVLKKIGMKFIVFNGHGDQSTITGYDNEPIIQANDNENLLYAKVVYARSCQSAKYLGKKSISKGCIAYLGYDDDFVFMIEVDKITHPFEDKTAKLFLDPSNYLVLSLFKGHTVYQASQRSKEKYRKTILKLMTSVAKKEDKDLIPFLARDYIHQVCLGDQNATI